MFCDIATQQPPELAQDLAYGFNGAIGLEFVEIDTDRVVATLDVAITHLQPYGLVHGGIHCAVIEATTSVGAAYWAITEGLAGAVGVSNTTDFLRPVRGGALEVEATPIHRGRRQQLWQATVHNDGRLVARGQVRLHNLDDPAAVGGLTPPTT